MGGAWVATEADAWDAIMNQPMKVLIGYDGSSCADRVLLDLRRAGLPPAVEAVVMGARGLRGIQRFLLGSVSTAVAARAHCSVEVVRLRHEV
jgi:hypothetical protein